MWCSWFMPQYKILLAAYKKGTSILIAEVHGIKQISYITLDLHSDYFSDIHCFTIIYSFLYYLQANQYNVLIVIHMSNPELHTLQRVINVDAAM